MACMVLTMKGVQVSSTQLATALCSFSINVHKPESSTGGVGQSDMDGGSSRHSGFLAEADRRLWALTRELTLAEARERERIANGLHDDLGQVLVAMGYKLDELGDLLYKSQYVSLAPVLEEAHALWQQAVATTRSVTFDLCGPLLRRFNFKAAVEALASNIARKAQWQLVIEGELPTQVVPEPMQAVLLRAVRELLFNAEKHACARRVCVTLHAHTHQWMVCVVDDGEGFIASLQRDHFCAKGGYGLVSIEAQMQALGGSLSIESAHGEGTRAVLCLPLPTDARAAQ